MRLNFSWGGDALPLDRGCDAESFDTSMNLPAYFFS